MSRAPVIVTGQQAGLFGGPLFVAFKVIGAIHLAEALGGRAVYWLETNDADWEEVHHVHLPSERAPLRLALEANTQGAPIGMVRLGENAADLVRQALAALPATSYRSDLLALLLDIYRAGRTWADVHEDLARRWFAPLGADIFRPDDAAFRAFAKPFLLKELESTPMGAQAHVFVLDERRGRPARRAIFRKETGWETREGEKIRPEDFVLLPSVMTRSVVQDAWFNAHSYVAGPGEVAYLTSPEMAAQYRKHGVQGAAVVPRMSAALVTPEEAATLQGLGLSAETVAGQPLEDLRKDWRKRAGDHHHAELEAKAEALRQRYQTDLTSLGLEVPLVEATLWRLQKALLGAKREAVTAREAAPLAALQTLSASLRPLNQRAERVWNLVPFLSQYGPDFLPWLKSQHDFARRVLPLPTAL